MSRTLKLTLLIGLCVLGTGVYADDVELFEVEDDKNILNLYDKVKYRSCDEVRGDGPYNVSGVYNIYPNTTEPLWVYCRFDGKKTVTSIMGQKHGWVNFKRGWKEYKHGFGHPWLGDYWVGLKTMKKVSDEGSRVLTIVMQDWKNKIQTIKYRQFRLDSEYSSYRLMISGYTGSIPDDFSFNNGMSFFTYDHSDYNSCVANYKGGWWYNDDGCTHMLPTGHYYRGGRYTPSGDTYDGIYYNEWRGNDYSLKSIRMDLSVS